MADRQRKRRGNGQGTLYRRVEGGPWVASWYDHTGKRIQRSTRTIDRTAAQRILNKHVADAALRRDGVIDPRLDEISRQSKRAVVLHGDNDEAKRQAAKRDPKHITTSIGYIKAIRDSSSWMTIGDIHVDDVIRYAGTLKQDGRSSRTIQAYMTAAKGFTRWLTRQGKLAADPLVSLNKPNPQADRRRERRMLLLEEWEWVRSATKDAEVNFGLSGTERVLLYATAIQTGLRSSELRALTRGQLFLDADLPFITCKAGSTKNRKMARQYVTQELAEQLEDHISRKAPKTPVFSMPRDYEVADMFRADVARARRMWIDAVKHDPEAFAKREQSDFLSDRNHEDQRLDFHCLRHTCGAWLAMTGAHPKAVQAVMRHSTITLTMDTYGHLFPGQEAETVARFPEMLGSPDEAAEATGTDGAAAECKQLCKQWERKPARSSATARDVKADPAGDVIDHKSLRGEALRNPMQRSAKKKQIASSGTRTPNPLIKSQLLCQLS